MNLYSAWDRTTNTVRPATRDEFVVSYGGDTRRVALDEIGGVRVSTVFLARDHGFDDGLPVLWETMSFDKGETGFPEQQERYTSYEAAVAGHARVCGMVRHYLDTKQETL